MTDLAEKLAVLQKNTRQDSEYISAMKLNYEKEKERNKIDSESVEGKKITQLSGPSSESIRLKTRTEPD